MAIQSVYRIVYNRPLAQDVFLLRLAGPSEVFTAPGQFVNLRIDGCYLRRPLSVCEVLEDGILLIYKVVGQGTARLAMCAPGTELDLLAGLGNGFSVGKAKGKRVVLVGGGVGVPPLYDVAKRLAKIGQPPAVVLGFAGKEDVFYQKEFENLGCSVFVATMDGSQGEAGTVLAPLAHLEFDYYCACGPERMLAAVHAFCAERGVEGQLSFEARMGCGFGVCMSCSCQTLTGTKRICREGPILFSREVVFA